MNANTQRATHVAASGRSQRFDEPRPPKAAALNAHQRAAILCRRAEKLGLDAPTETMIADALNDAASNAVQDFIVWMASNGLEGSAEHFEKLLEASNNPTEPP
jgi:CTP:molybdopterin cytidylyltransferase MocA